MSVYVTICHDMSGYVGICRCMPRYVRICRDIFMQVTKHMMMRVVVPNKSCMTLSTTSHLWQDRWSHQTDQSHNLYHIRQWIYSTMSDNESTMSDNESTMSENESTMPHNESTMSDIESTMSDNEEDRNEIFIWNVQNYYKQIFYWSMFIWMKGWGISVNAIWGITKKGIVPPSGGILQGKHILAISGINCSFMSPGAELSANQQIHDHPKKSMACLTLYQTGPGFHVLT